MTDNPINITHSLSFNIKVLKEFYDSCLRSGSYEDYTFNSSPEGQINYLRRLALDLHYSLTDPNFFVFPTLGILCRSYAQPKTHVDPFFTFSKYSDKLEEFSGLLNDDLNPSLNLVVCEISELVPTDVESDKEAMIHKQQILFEVIQDLTLRFKSLASNISLLISLFDEGLIKDMITVLIDNRMGDISAFYNSTLSRFDEILSNLEERGWCKEYSRVLRDRYGFCGIYDRLLGVLGPDYLVSTPYLLQQFSEEFERFLERERRLYEFKNYRW